MPLEEIFIKVSWYFHSEMQPRNISFNFSKSLSILRFSVMAIFFSHFFVPIELFNLNLKHIAQLLNYIETFLFLEDSIVNLILSHVSGANFVYLFVMIFYFQQHMYFGSFTP